MLQNARNPFLSWRERFVVPHFIARRRFRAQRRGESGIARAAEAKLVPFFRVVELGGEFFHKIIRIQLVGELVNLVQNFVQILDIPGRFFAAPFELGRSLRTSTRSAPNRSKLVRQAN